MTGPRRKPGPLPRRYRRKEGHTNFDLSQKREAANRAAGIPVEAVVLRDRPVPNTVDPPAVDWCEPLDPAFLPKR